MIDEIASRAIGGPVRGRLLRPAGTLIIVSALGLLITVITAGTVRTVNRHSENRLLEVQTRQAAAVLASTIQGLRDPLATALQTATVTGGNVDQFEHFASPYVSKEGAFASVSLWSLSPTPHPLATVGSAPALSPASSTAVAFITRALHSPTFVVTSVAAGATEHIAYAIADPSSPGFVVYAERAIPANRQVPVEKGSAFSDLNYATYLGAETPADLATTDLRPSRLPLTGAVARQTIPFGDSTLILVAQAHGQLAGPLGGQLPWIVLIVGAALSLAAATAASYIVRGRREAEQNASTISDLYQQLDGLYYSQRTIADTLQRALVPQSTPHVPGLEIATRYVAGAEGVDIGGDWYSVDRLDERRVAFVVGDVSGQGVAAAAIMARLRFTIRAYLLEGHPPDVALAMCSGQLDIIDDGHMATVLVGVADVASREIALANAGHFNPLVIAGAESSYADTEVGPPLGIGSTGYVCRQVTLAPGSTVLAFTDGLVERRDEHIDVGLQRLARAASIPGQAVDDLLGGIIAALASDGPDDDIAILGLRWT